MSQRITGGVALASVALLAALPLAIDSYTVNQCTLVYLLMASALAWNWLGGFLGQISFGHAAMFGVGGFTAARLMLSLAWPAPLAWLAGGVCAGLYALGARPTLKLRGPYFSIATIGLSEASRLVFTFWDSFTGGASGVSLPVLGAAKQTLYFWALALAALAGLASWLLRRSSVGMELLAIRADVDAAGDVGVSAYSLQSVVLLASGAVVGVSGGLYASYFGFIEPGDMFGFDRSIAFVLMGVIGGLGTVLGPVLGAFVFVLVQQFLLASYRELYLGLYGLLLIAIILFEPLGLTGVWLRLWRFVEARLAPQRLAAMAPQSEPGAPELDGSPSRGEGS
jgi:branched-chain amino acid transport system permease protein